MPLCTQAILSARVYANHPDIKTAPEEGSVAYQLVWYVYIVYAQVCVPITHMHRP